MIKKLLLLYPIILISIYLVLSGCKDSITASDIDSRVMPQSNISFNADLEPVFQLKCNGSGCHDDGSRAGGLSLTSCVNAKEDIGVIVPGSSATSIIVWAVEGKPNYAMPPVGVTKPFTSEQSRGLKKWIDEGAKCN
jgi:hypothetical protein